MAKLATSNRDTTGLCWWCHTPVSMGDPYRGTDPSIDIPGVGVVVCTPACPDRPDGVTVFSRKKEW
jgi:hypothetical protein